MHSSLVNFNAPIAVRKRFDALCMANGRTRTSVLLELMQNYVLAEAKRLAALEQELCSLDEYFQKSQVLNKVHQHSLQKPQNCNSFWENKGSHENDLPTSFFSDGLEEW